MQRTGLMTGKLAMYSLRRVRIKLKQLFFKIAYNFIFFPENVSNRSKFPLSSGNQPIFIKNLTDLYKPEFFRDGDLLRSLFLFLSKILKALHQLPF